MQLINRGWGPRRRGQKNHGLGVGLGLEHAVLEPIPVINIGRARCIFCPTNPTKLVAQLSYLPITFQRPCCLFVIDHRFSATKRSKFCLGCTYGTNFISNQFEFESIKHGIIHHMIFFVLILTESFAERSSYTRSLLYSLHGYRIVGRR